MSNRNIKDIIQTNKGLQEDIKNNNFLQGNLIGVLKNIERIIPMEARDNFYNNIETLRITSSLDQSFSSVNTTLVNLDNKLNFVVNNNCKSPSGIDYEEMLAMELYHELLHVSGTHIDIVDGKCVGHSGFQEKVEMDNGEVEYSNDNELNGINEGFTQYLTLQTFGKEIEYDSSDYAKQILAAKKLVDAAGIDEVKKVYFDNKMGMESLKKALEKNGYSPELYKELEKECHVEVLNIVIGQDVKNEKTKIDNEFIATLKEQISKPEEIIQKDIEHMNSIKEEKHVDVQENKYI